MADLSKSFDPDLPAINSDAASDAGSKAVVAGSDASDAASAAASVSSVLATAVDTINKCVKCNVRVHAWLGTTMQDLVNNTWTLVEMDNEVFDDGNDFNITTHLFTAPVTGYYFITATIGLQNVVADAVYDAQVDKNSGTMLTAANSATGNITSQVAILVAGVFKLTANDTIGIKVRSRSGGNTVDVLGGASGYTNVCIILLAV